METEHLQERLNEIEASLPILLADSTDPRDFWSSFAEKANHLAVEAGPEHKGHVHACLNQMLRERGMIKARPSPTLADVADEVSVAM